MNLFHQAISSYDLTLFNELLKSNNPNRENINEIDLHTGFTPLQLAMFLGRFDMAVQLLIFGADPNERNEDSHHLLYQITRTRNYGNVFSSLLRLAPGIEEAYKAYCDDINPEVFHILFFTALTNNRDAYALRMLNVTLLSLNNDLRTEIINNLTGALYYSTLYKKEGIAKQLIELGVNKVNNKLPNLGVGLIYGLTETESKEISSVPLHDAIKTKDYIAMAKNVDGKAAANLPMDSTYFPWMLMKKVSIYHDVNQLIKREQWDTLKQVLDAGYTLDNHLHELIIRDKKAELIVLFKLAKFPGFEEKHIPLLRKMFLLAIFDNF